jgi:nicotinamide riboside kinase
VGLGRLGREGAPVSGALVVGIVGAESTGKTALACALRDALAAGGTAVALVGEALREFCDRHARTPRRDEQQAIAAEQSRRIREAASGHAVVVADTTALMTAVYSDWVFGDRSLYDDALRDHADCSLTLLTAADLPWVADGLQRDGAHVRDGIAHSIVCGSGAARQAAALAAFGALRGRAPVRKASWVHVCERCGEPACERHPLPRG